MKAKPIYYVYLTNKNVPFGMQQVKANNQKEAREKFKKRFPKSRIMDVSSRIDEPTLLDRSMAI